MNLFCLTRALCLILFGALPVLCAQPVFTVSTVGSPAGAPVNVGLSIDDAGGAASISVQIDFDPMYVEALDIVTPPGSLGSQFNFNWELGAGVLTLNFTSATNMPPGGGLLANLNFFIANSAVEGSFRSISVGSVTMFDESGNPIDVGDGSQHVDGRIISSLVPFTDSDLDGLPDEWEALYSMDTNADSALLDNDSDGVVNLLEFAFDMNPLSIDVTGLPFVGVIVIGNKTYLTLHFNRLISSQTITYTVEVSSDINTWNSAETLEYQTATDNGNGKTETAYFRDMVALEDSEVRFIRVKVDTI